MIRVKKEKKTYRSRKTAKMNRFQESSLKDSFVSKDEITMDLPACKDDIEQQKIMWNRFLEETRCPLIKENVVDYQLTSEVEESSSVSAVLENKGREQNVSKGNDFETSNENNKSISGENSALENIYSTHKSLVEASKIKQKKMASQNESKLIFYKKMLTKRKKKCSVLEESRCDWDRFKKEQGIDEDLAYYNKGRAGYLGKHAFLNRCDWRSFEYERNTCLSRLKSKVDEVSVVKLYSICKK